MAKSGSYVLALDQGTTSSRAILYDETGKEVRIASRALVNHFPKPGWVEQDPMEIWRTQSEALAEAVSGIDASSIRAIGITNQRETVVAWDRKSGTPLAPAIVWQCRRSAEICARIRSEGLETLIRSETGLVVDAYFSGSKIRWMLENISGLRERVKRHEVVFGTVDSWILDRLSRESGKPEFKTEPSNASRTMMMAITNVSWSPALLDIFGVSTENLAEIVPSNSKFAEASFLGVKIPITGILGDQQAALFGHGCQAVDDTKCTFGTGAFLLTNTGESIRLTSAGMLQTVAWQLALSDGSHKTTYALEGSVFVAGALIQWLRDKLGLIAQAKDSEELAAQVENSAGVVVVPAFVGLGAPHWVPEVRAAILGLTRDSSAAHIVRASLESVAHQVADLLEAEEFLSVKAMRIDGGMSTNKLFCQLLSDLSGRDILVSTSAEVTALGAASLAALHDHALDKPGGVGGVSRKYVSKFQPRQNNESATSSRVLWKRGLAAVKTFSQGEKRLG